MVIIFFCLDSSTHVSYNFLLDQNIAIALVTSGKQLVSGTSSHPFAFLGTDSCQGPLDTFLTHPNT
jgi:hypothetical protein